VADVCLAPLLLCFWKALLAGGTFNGELVIWDLSKEDANAQVGCARGTRAMYVYQQAAWA